MSKIKNKLFNVIYFIIYLLFFCIILNYNFNIEILDFIHKYFWVFWIIGALLYPILYLIILYQKIRLIVDFIIILMIVIFSLIIAFILNLIIGIDSLTNGGYWEYFQFFIPILISSLICTFFSFIIGYFLSLIMLKKK